MNEMFCVNVSLPKTFSINSLLILVKPVINFGVQNIRKAGQNLNQCLHQNFTSRDNQLLYEWKVNAKKHYDGKRMEASNFVTDPSSHVNTQFLLAAFLLCNIMHYF